MEARATPSGEFEAEDDKTTPGADPLIGQEPLGQYRIVKKIGEGGFGAVYLADQIGVGRKAVIKVLRADLAGSDAFIKRFQREASVLGALDHHNLVRLFNFGTLEGNQLFLAMEYGGDRTLAEEIKQQGRLDLSRSLRIAEQVCLALHDAHAHGVVHRDLKPANIMLGQKEGRDWVKVVDVGIAKILDSGDIDDGQAQLTADGAIIGTPAYFSPEQARSLPLDGRSDVYSMGCVLYEMVAGKLPLNGKTPVDFVRAHCMDAPIQLRDRGIRVPPALQKLLDRALAKTPGQRPTAAEMAAELSAVRTGLSAKQKVVLPWRTAALSAGGVLALAAAGFWVLREEPRRAPRPVAVAAAPSQLEEKPAPAGEEPEPTAAGKREPAAVAASLVPAPVEPQAAPQPAAVERPRQRRSKADPWAARTTRVADLRAARRYPEAIAAGEKMLGEGPPPAIKGLLYKELGNASYDSGDSEAALRYLELYRPSCPPGELPALNKRIDRLRSDLGLAPGR